MGIASYFLSGTFQRLYGSSIPVVLRYKALAQFPSSILKRVFSPVSVHPPLSPWQAKPARKSVIPKNPEPNYLESYERMKPKPGFAAL
jgi:hypothetical protein